jgi:hypothetical protein
MQSAMMDDVHIGMKDVLQCVEKQGNAKEGRRARISLRKPDLIRKRLRHLQRARKVAANAG